MGWWTELVGEDGVEMGRTYTTRMGRVSGGSPPQCREQDPSKQSCTLSTSSPWVSWAGNRMTTMACARIAQWNPGFKVPCTYHRVRTGVRAARQAQTGTSRHDRATTNEGLPDAFARTSRSRQKPPPQLSLTVVRHAGQKTQAAAGRWARLEPGRGRVTERSLEKWRQVLCPL